MSRAAAATLALALGACAAPLERPVPPELALSAPALLTLDAWQATGRLAVRTATSGFNASFEWREQPGRGEIAVHGPFGAGATHISRGADLIRIDTGHGHPIDVAAPFTDLEPTLVAELGAPLPLDTLRYWILGVPAPGAASAPADDGAFTQSGWTIHPEEPVAVAGAPAALPHRVTLERDATRIRVVVDTWTVGGA